MKRMKTLILISLVILCTLAAVSCDKKDRETEYYRAQIEAVVEYTGLRYIGDIDSYEISKKAGDMVNTKAVDKEVLRLAGYPEDSIIRRSYVGTYGEFDLMKAYVLKAEYEGQLLYDMTVVEELLYADAV